MKLLILLMSCNQEHFITQSKIIKQSLYKQIEKYNLQDKIDVYDYIGEADKLHLKDGTIYCTSIDKTQGSYLKTIECLNYINKHIEYDYIFRTNTSTFINVYLLYKFICNIKDTSIIYGSDLYFTHAYCPGRYDIEARGNGIIFSKENINIILNNKYKFIENKKYKNAGTGISQITGEIEFLIDDACLSAAINTFYLEQGYNRIEIFNKYRSYYHGWLDCDTGTSIIRHITNGLCEWENTNIDYYFLKNFITIQIKSYNPYKKHNDNNKIKLLTKIFTDNTYNDDINNIVDINMNHYKNQNIYIGTEYELPYISQNEIIEFYKNNKL